MGAEEEHTLRENLYLRHELEMLLERAGFAAVAVLGGYAGEPVAPERTMLVFVAHKAG